MSKPVKKIKAPSPSPSGAYSGLVGGISELLEAARHASARTVNAFMTATYWDVGRRIVKFEQDGQKRADYGEVLLERLSKDLTAQHGRGFSRPNLIRFRQFYQAFPVLSIRSTVSNESCVELNPSGSTVSNARVWLYFFIRQREKGQKLN